MQPAKRQPPRCPPYHAKQMVRQGRGRFETGCVLVTSMVRATIRIRVQDRHPFAKVAPLLAPDKADDAKPLRQMPRLYNYRTTGTFALDELAFQTHKFANTFTGACSLSQLSP